jgi:ABC-type branched-subunit amino acid transport system substrate-binding protein
MSIGIVVEDWLDYYRSDQTVAAKAVSSGSGVVAVSPASSTVVATADDWSSSEESDVE